MKVWALWLSDELHGLYTTEAKAATAAADARDLDGHEMERLDTDGLPDVWIEEMEVYG